MAMRPTAAYPPVYPRDGGYGKRGILSLGGQPPAARFSNVVTSVDFERMADPQGPTRGRLLPRSDGKPSKNGVREHACLCSDDGVRLIRDDVANEAVTHVMIAACSRRAKSDAFDFPGVATTRANLREGVIDVGAAFGRFERGRHARDAAADDDDRLCGRDRTRHGKFSCARSSRPMRRL